MAPIDMKIYTVGGAVRDELLGLPVQDRDFVVVGASPEAMLANACGLRVAGLSCITNMAAGILNQALTHTEVFETSQKAMANMKKLILQFRKELAKENL